MAAIDYEKLHYLIAYLHALAAVAKDSRVIVNDEILRTIKAIEKELDN